MESITKNFNENLYVVQQQTKGIDSSRKHQTKKQIFGEIKNVIHNQGFATPSKQEQPTNKDSYSKLFVYSNLKCKQIESHSKPIKNHEALKTKSAMDEISLFDYIVYRGPCCAKPCKSDQQIWSEMNLFDDSFLNKLFDCNLPQGEKSISEILPMEGHTASEFFNESENNYSLSYWPDAAEDYEVENNIHFYLEKPDDIEDDLFI